MDSQLQEAAKEYAATGWFMIDGGTKEYNEEIYKAVIYGASLSRPSLDIDKVVEQLEKANPTEFSPSFKDLDIWQTWCDKLKQLLNQSK